MSLLAAPRQTSKRGARPNLEQLRQQVAQLEQLQKASGASAVPQDKPGLFATVVDLLSRPNYALAGITEEFLNGKSVTSAFGRGINELLSGVGELEGQKRAFGQVLEAQGVPTKTLAQAFPLLEDTWVGNFGSRGAAGIALDILTDPLTYVTLGASSARAVTLKSGRHILSKQGLARMGEIAQQSKYVDEAGRAAGLVDDAARVNAQRAVRRAARDEFESEFIDSTGKVLKQEYLDPGGVKFFGQMVPGTSMLGRRFSAQMVNAANTVPGGKVALQGAKEFSDGLGMTIRSLLHPFNELGKLPPELRAEAMRLHRDFTNASAAYRLRQVQTLKQLEKGWFRELKKDPELGRKFYEIRERTGSHPLSPEQQELFDGFAKLYDGALDTAIGAGTLPEEAARIGFFHHVYTKDVREGLALFHDNAGFRSTNSVVSNYRKDRVFDTLQEAMDTSKRLNALDPRYPVLEPSYDLLGNTYKYINRHSDDLARKAWQEEMVRSFGRDPIRWDAAGHYDLARIANAPKFDDFFEGHNFREMGKDALKDDPIVQGAKVGNDKTEGAKRVADKAKDFARNLSDEDKKAFMARMVSTTNSAPQMADILNHFDKDFRLKYLPSETGVVAGEHLHHFGMKTKYVSRSGGWWGDAEVYIPKIIADDFERVNSKLLNTQQFKDFGKLIRGYDKLNNIFKLGVYTLWPASAFRDMYSNVALSMLDIGTGALNPKSHFDAVGVMAGRQGQMRTANGVVHEWSSLRKMAEEMGVAVPGEVFAELTGDALAQSGTVAKTLKKATHYRGLIENEARMQLWLQNIRRGLDPRDAADKVRDFLFDYGELSSVERELFRRLIPFYTFTRKNIQLQAKMLVTKPGMSINQLKPFRQRNDEAESMVKWEAEAAGIRLDRDGRTVHSIQGVDLPLRNLDTLWTGTTKGSFRRIMGMVSPLLKVPIEAGTGTDFFTGGDMKRTRGDAIGRGIEWLDNNTGFPQGAKDWIGYSKNYDRAGRPQYTFDGVKYALLVRSWAFSRLVSTSDRQFREYLEDGNVSGALLDFTTGLRDKEINLDEEQRRKLNRRVRQLEDSLVRRGIKREFTRTFTPKQRGPQ